MEKRVFSILGFVVMFAVLMEGCGSPNTSGLQKGGYVAEAVDNAEAGSEYTKEKAMPEREGDMADDSAGASWEAGEKSADGSAAAGEDWEAKYDKFYVYSWDGELGERLEYVYEAYPEIRDRVQYVCTDPQGDFREEIGRLLQAPEAEAYPDMIAMDAGWMLEYTNSDSLLPVTECGITDADLGEMNPYTITIAMDKRDYTLKGISWQSSPGAFFYRADLAETFLGVKNPEEMQERVGSWEKFLEAAKEVNEKSGGATKILASDDGILEIAMFHKAQPWVTSDGVFHMDDAAFAYMDVVSSLEKEGLTQNAGQGTGEWKEGFSDDSVLGYFGGVRFPDNSIRPNCGGEAAGQGTYGLWNVCQGPVPYSLGGTWLGVTAGCSDTALAGKIMKVLCCDGDMMAKIAEGTQDYVNNKAVIQKLYGDGKGSCDLLGGQDPVEIFASVADKVEAFWMTVYDQEINGWLESQAAAYAAGEKGKDEAVEDFREKVAGAWLEE